MTKGKKMNTIKDAWKLVYDNMLDISDRRFKWNPRMKYEDAEIWTRLLATAMSLIIFFVTIFIPIYLLCKYAFGIELGFMWLLDTHIAVFALVLMFISYETKIPIIMVIAMFISGYGIWIQQENSPYGIREKKSIVLDILTLGASNGSYMSITIGESFCAFREYQGNTCKNYIHYVIGKEYAKAEEETKKILKEKELEAIKQTEKEIKANTLSRRLGNITSSYKGGKNE